MIGDLMVLNRDWGKGHASMKINAKMLATLKFSPIEEAPIRPGEEFGWCLIAPGGDDEWTVAHYNGEGWFGTDGLPRDPQVWVLLPKLKHR
jgi:hypothetical protein